jgi:hypothetical protein
MKRFLLSFVISLSVLSLFSQKDSLNNYSVRCFPEGGVNKLIFQYYKIKFSEEQRKFLSGRLIEFFFHIENYKLKQ